MGITDGDSIKYNLKFERFMNKERMSCWRWFWSFSEDDGKKISFEKMGLYCCNIVTFNTKCVAQLKTLVSFRMTLQETQELCNLVQEDENKKEFVEDKIREKHKQLFEYVDIVTGTITSLGRHAAGLVVSPHEVDKAFGTLYISSDDKPISQINMKEIDSLNYVKLDCWVLDSVGLIDRTCKAANIPFLTPDNLDF